MLYNLPPLTFCLFRIYHTGRNVILVAIQILLHQPPSIEVLNLNHYSLLGIFLNNLIEISVGPQDKDTHHTAAVCPPYPSFYQAISIVVLILTVAVFCTEDTPEKVSG